METVFKSVVFILITAALAVSACKKEERCSVHPEAFRFSLADSETSSDLLASGVYSAENIKIYYFYKDERNSLIVNSETTPGGRVEMYSAQLPMVSLTGRSDIFFLELSPQETDTLIVVVEKEDRGDCDYHPYALVKHNGNELPVQEGETFILKK
jgi:hypothetical protein